jgi:hypothetical protein
MEFPDVFPKTEEIATDFSSFKVDEGRHPTATSHPT